MNDKTSEALRSRATFSIDHAIPSALAKRGIQRVTDNLDGRDLVLPPNTISIFFGKEILRALEARRLARTGQAARTEGSG